MDKAGIAAVGRKVKKFIPQKMYISLEKTPLISSIISFKNQDKVAQYYLEYSCLPIEENKIFYSSRVGTGMICNPFAIFLQLLNDKDFSHFNHIWVVDNLKETERLTAEYINYPNVTIVWEKEDNGRAFLKHLATAKYLFNSSPFKYYFNKREGQIYTNTWHGIALKKMGFDTPTGAVRARNQFRNFIQSDYLLMPNPFMTKIWKNSYKLDGLYAGKIIEEGYPRNDLLLNADKNVVIDTLKKHGISVDPNKKIILYAPTWQGLRPVDVIDDTEKYEQLYKILNSKIDTSQYQILIKTHNFLYNKLSAKKKSSGYYVPKFIETNAFMSIVDILISDYSSIYFDFLVSDRPVLFYFENLEGYQQDRGIYFSREELPGPSTSDVNTLANFINNIDAVTAEYRPNYLKTKQFACPYEDGKVSERVVDIIFRGNGHYNIISDFDKKRKKLLVFCGILKKNNPSKKMLEFLNGLDYSKFDVTVYCKKQEIKSLQKLNKNVRIVVKIGAHIATWFEHYKVARLLKVGLKNKASQEEFFAREYRRAFGDIEFDHAINFFANDTYFTAFFAHIKNAKKTLVRFKRPGEQLTRGKSKILKRFSSAYDETIVYDMSYEAFKKEFI